MIAPTGSLRYLVLGAVASLLIGCEPTRSFEMVADGTLVYLDTLSEADKAEARETIVNGLQRGLEAYRLMEGDVVEILFHDNRQPTKEEYVIGVGDGIAIEFLNAPDYGREVRVTPDGLISSPLRGTIRAAGLTTRELAAIIREEYRGILLDPVVIVNIRDYRGLIDDMDKVLGTDRLGRSKQVTVSPDGTVSLPFLPPVQALGHTLQDLKGLIDQTYASSGRNIEVSVLLQAISSGHIFVFGEVALPGTVVSRRPRTVLMAIAAAGGVTPDGSMQAVRVFYIDEDRTPRVRSVNLTNVLEKLWLEEDMLVPDNSVIYVPPTKLAKAGRLVDQVVRRILLFNGFGFNASYIVNQKSGGGSTVIQGN